MTDSDLPPIHSLVPDVGRPRLKDKVVIVTGANSPMGIGRAAAFRAAESGARALYLCDRHGGFLDAQARQLRAAFPSLDVLVRHFDAASEVHVKAVVDDALSRYQRLDVFFANAGVGGDHVPFTQASAEDFMSVLRVNTMSVFIAAKHAAPAMSKTSASKPSPGGSIIATASVAGLRANAGPTAYSASKAAVVSLAQTMSYQLAGTGVRVNAICPGLIQTAMTAPLWDAARAKGTQGKIDYRH
ncbi:hypothetical protein XA68_16079 [Ophiocordyceps unilateralis]|uniref:Ketoreductase (KR) domain-containing protein n=1 Tax=Ophiocordyceps unilateralis TaxID=268505 RepID=A0A2A9PKF8_OPHUN|nr:hypothetical protein XA68_16079 [Ophiocordyceps unilateralis]